jgi:hypothetical protein
MSTRSSGVGTLLRDEEVMPRSCAVGITGMAESIDPCGTTGIAIGWCRDEDRCCEAEVGWWEVGGDTCFGDGAWCCAEDMCCGGISRDIEWGRDIWGAWCWWGIPDIDVCCCCAGMEGTGIGGGAVKDWCGAAVTCWKDCGIAIAIEGSK